MNYSPVFSKGVNLNTVFGSLADETRRDILNRVSKKQLSVSEIAKHYKLTFAAISKHLKVLEKAKLVIKHRRGKEQIVSISSSSLAEANSYLATFEQHWESRMNNLDKLLSKQ